MFLNLQTIIRRTEGARTENKQRWLSSTPIPATQVKTFYCFECYEHKKHELTGEFLFLKLTFLVSMLGRYKTPNHGQKKNEMTDEFLFNEHCVSDLLV